MTRDPFDRIPDPDSRYAGTILETTAEREQRAACPEPDRDTARDIGAQRASELLARAGDDEWLGI